MAFVNTTNLALPGSAVKGDGSGTWVAQWNQICANLESRLTKSGSGSPSGLVAGDYVGQKYYRIDVPGEIWQCTLAGSIGVATWTNAVVATTFNTVGASVFGGTVALNENTTLLSTKKLIVPAGESWLRKSGGTEDMNPHAHAARHRPGATPGVWTIPNDLLPFSIQNIIESTVQYSGNSVSGTSILSQLFGVASTAKCSVILDILGRPTTSHALVYCEAKVSLGASTNVTMQLVLGSTSGTVATVGTLLGFGVQNANNGSITQERTISAFRYVRAIPAHSTSEVAMHLTAAGIVSVTNVQVSYIDLGTE